MSQSKEDSLKKVAIIGSRGFSNYFYLRDKVFQVLKLDEVDEIISGGAIGVDSMAKKFAVEMDISFFEYLPNYDSYGKRAPFIRNVQIANDCDILIAFWDGKSRGTQFTIQEAKKKKKQIIVFKII